MRFFDGRAALARTASGSRSGRAVGGHHVIIPRSVEVNLQVVGGASSFGTVQVAHALLAVIAAREHDLRPASDGLIALTCNEIRRLFTTYVIEPGRALTCPMAWSRWRRRHQPQVFTAGS